MAAGDTKVVYSAETSLTVSSLQSLASSASAGWQSDVVDNTTDRYVDALVQIVLSFANTAPGSSKCAFVYAFAGLDTTYTNPASGAEGAISLPDVTANAQNLRLLGTVPYTTQNEVAESAVLSVAQAFGGLLPPKWGIVLVNHAGAALTASGNSVKWRGVYYNVAAA